MNEWVGVFSFYKELSFLDGRNLEPTKLFVFIRLLVLLFVRVFCQMTRDSWIELD